MTRWIVERLLAAHRVRDPCNLAEVLLFMDGEPDRKG
jgi:hypothetical protein